MKNFRHQIKQELNYHRIVFDFQDRPHEPWKNTLEYKEDDYCGTYTLDTLMQASELNTRRHNSSTDKVTDNDRQVKKRGNLS